MSSGNLIPAGLIACLALTACGKKGTPAGNDASYRTIPSPAGPDLSTPDAALASVTRAVEAGDFEALSVCATKDGIEGVRRDLLAWNALLSDPITGPRILARIPPPRDEAEKARYRAGFTGDPAGLLHMIARCQESDAGPVARAEVIRFAKDVERLELDRVQRDGTRRRVVLVWSDGAWRADRVAL